MKGITFFGWFLITFAGRPFFLFLDQMFDSVDIDTEGEGYEERILHGRDPQVAHHHTTDFGQLGAVELLRGPLDAIQFCADQEFVIMSRFLRFPRSTQRNPGPLGFLQNWLELQSRVCWRYKKK